MSLVFASVTRNSCTCKSSNSAMHGYYKFLVLSSVCVHPTKECAVSFKDVNISTPIMVYFNTPYT